MDVNTSDKYDLATGASKSSTVTKEEVLTTPSAWDPFSCRDQQVLTQLASARIKRDLMTLYKEPPPGIFAIGQENNIQFIHALIVGVMDTPYEGGFFYFVIKCPNDYPWQPPKVKFMTTDAGKVRFNPNLYQNGKVCVSFLGTWMGPAWSPALQLSSVLVSIQSLMCQNPYFNEPGYSYEKHQGDSDRYNQIIQHETFRVAICGMLENETNIMMCPQLREVMENTFLGYYDLYIDTVSNLLHLDGITKTNPFSMTPVTFKYKEILSRLRRIHDRLTNKVSKKLLNSNNCGDVIENETETKVPIKNEIAEGV